MIKRIPNWLTLDPIRDIGGNEELWRDVSLEKLQFDEDIMTTVLSIPRRGYDFARDYLKLEQMMLINYNYNPHIVDVGVNIERNLIFITIEYNYKYEYSVGENDE